MSFLETYPELSLAPLVSQQNRERPYRHCDDGVWLTYAAIINKSDCGFSMVGTSGRPGRDGFVRCIDCRRGFPVIYLHKLACDHGLCRCCLTARIVLTQENVTTYPEEWKSHLQDLRAQLAHEWRCLAHSHRNLKRQKLDKILFEAFDAIEYTCCNRIIPMPRIAGCLDMVITWQLYDQWQLILSEMGVEDLIECPGAQIGQYPIPGCGASACWVKRMCRFWSTYAGRDDSGKDDSGKDDSGKVEEGEDKEKEPENTNLEEDGA